jgi:hypothetical protein
MKEIKQAKSGLGYLDINLSQNSLSITKAFFWQIKHNSGQIEVSLKIGRYKKNAKVIWLVDGPVCSDPKSEITLNEKEWKAMVDFISENHQPIKDNVKYYIPFNEKFDATSIKHLKAIFNNEEKKTVLDFITPRRGRIPRACPWMNVEEPI